MPGGQRLLDLGDPGLHPLGDVLAVLALEHDDHARDLSPLPSRVTAPLRGIGPTPTSATSPSEDGTPSTEASDDPPQVLDARSRGRCPRTVKRSERCSTKPPLKEALLSATACTTWWSDEAVAVEPPRVDEHVVLLRQAAPGVDLGDAPHGAQPRAHVPVVERLLRPSGRRVALDEVLVDLAEGGRHRAERRLEARRGCARAPRTAARSRAGGRSRRGTPSSKTTVTIERPNFESERTSVAPGAPMSAVSIG